VRDYVVARQPAALDAYQTAAAEISKDLAALRAAEPDNAPQAGEIDGIAQEIGRWQSEWARPTIEKVKRGESIDITAVIRDQDSKWRAVRTRLLKLLDQQGAENLNHIRGAEQETRRLLSIVLGVALTLAAVLLFLTRAVTRIIAEPVLQLIEASERVSRGDFRPSLPAPADNEFGVLSRSFLRMTTALRQEREELAALNKFSEVVTQCTAEIEVYDHLLHSLKERFQPRQVIIFILKAAENFLEAAASLTPLPEHVRGWPVIEEPHNCKSVRMGRSFSVDDVTVEPLCPANFVSPTEGSYYCAPLIAGGIIIGAVRLEGAKDYWTPERVSLLEGYLSGAATALSNLRLLQSMKQQANVDELTGLYNRRFLEEYARKLFAMARRKSQPLGVIMMDLDHFKSFNDDYGHEIGDRILRQFAKTATQAIREANLAARFGGEEFVVLLPDTDAKSCVLVAERIRHAVERMVVPSGSDKPLPPLTVSLGIAVHPDHGQTLEEVLQASDKALYESKRCGRNRSTVYAEQVEPAT
jgi:diguanylate cyclase (GGDEF)-like protein